MPITVIELKARDRETGQNGDRQVRPYRVTGSDDDAALKAALLNDGNTPATYDDMIRVGARLTDQLDTQDWLAEVYYETPNFSLAETGSVSVSFDTSGGTIHLTQARNLGSAYGAPGEPVDLMNGIIGLNKDTIEGVDVQHRAFTFEVTKVFTSAQVTQAFVENIYALTGMVNSSTTSIVSDAFTMSFAAGELRFDGARGSQRPSGDWDLSFRFSASVNASDLTIPVGPESGDVIGPIAKLGWEYLWLRYVDKVNTTLKAIIPKPVAAYVNQVYLYANLNLLGLGS